jgi:hypothetical protein
LHQNAQLSNTHDLGFMISPWARKAWELERDQKAYESLITAAKALAGRYNATTKCLRSWDTCVTKKYAFTDPKEDFLVIIVRAGLSSLTPGLESLSDTRSNANETLG